MYNRYQGNTGRWERRPEPGDMAGGSPMPPPPMPPPPPRPNPAPFPPPPPPGGELSGMLRGLLGRLDPGRLETEDLLLAGLLYLLYRESGDPDFLLMAGGVLFL